MFTKWWKNCVKGMIAGCQPTYAFNLPVKATNGTTYYFANLSAYPGNVTVAFSLSNTAVGIHVGTGDTAATENDYTLASLITAGLSGVITLSKGMDANDCPYVTYNLVLTNSTSADIVVKEIGMFQQESCGASAGATSGLSNRVFMVDRTVLDTPVTVPANGNAAIYYTLKTSYDYDS